MDLVTGAGGFIGGHLVKRLLDEGRDVRAVDIKPFEDWWQLDPRAHLERADLRSNKTCTWMTDGCDRVFNLAADMGGMGFIEHNKALCMLNVLINTHLLLAARDAGVERYYFASTACVYPQWLQDGSATPNWTVEVPLLPAAEHLREEQAYIPGADPEDGYGWEKLFGERMCRHFREDFDLETRVGRHHTTYGPYGSWCDGREKVPAALSRKVAEAKRDHHHIEVWGDGRQIRSFLYVDDAVDGILRVMDSDIADPVNIGSEHTCTVNDLLATIEDIAEVETLERIYDPHAPQGVRARCSDSSLLKSLGWRETVSLREGLEHTYHWVEQQVLASA